jgi:hypothetical protein
MLNRFFGFHVPSTTIKPDTDFYRTAWREKLLLEIEMMNGSQIEARLVSFG